MAMCPEIHASLNGSVAELSFINFTRTVGLEERVYDGVKFCSYTILLPIIFLFGLVGNTLNIIVFTRSRYRHTLDDIEKSANAGLVALAISDLLFCLIGLPEPLLAYRPSANGGVLHMLSLHYATFKTPLMNVFLFSSTWLIVAISAERYVAVCYPFHARYFIQLRRTISVDIIIYVLSVCINIPGFLKWQYVRVPCDDGSTTTMLVMRTFYMQPRFREGYLVAWCVLGVFVPLVFLTLCNIRLMVEVYRSRARYTSERHKYTTSKVTLILMAIILMYLVLVCPSMLLTFFSDVLPQKGVEYFYRYQIATILTNVTQGINFAVNFILYCVVSKPFRDNVRRQLCRSSGTNRTLSETNRYELVGGHPPETRVTRAPRTNNTVL